MTKTTIGPNWQNHPEWGFATRQIHAGFTGDPTTGAQTVPIYATNAFHFPNAQTAAARFGLQELGPIYSRLTNPTNEALEGRLTSLEGGVGALVTSSGQGAITLALLTLASPGKNIVASPSIYGGTYNLLARTLARLGLETRFVTDPRHLVDWKDLTDENTIAYYGEVIPNPQGDVLDLEPLANLAHDFGVPLVVDNTVPTPYLCRPIEWGADIVVHSATKYLGGHGSALLGAIVDAGRFDFADQAVAARFPGFNQPDDSYHGVVYARDFGVGGALGANLAFILKARAEGLRDLGFTASPFAVWAVGLGVDTLSLRVARHVENARAVAEHLQSLVGGGVVQTVRWSSLPSSPYYQLAQKYTPKGAGAVLNFDLTGGLEAGKRFIDSLELLANVANIGDVRSLAIHPASTTHSQLSEAELAAQGISAGTVRISVGIEDSQDIIADIDRGLAAAKAV
ncbi:O-acetylhomoserine aminocarboxypropyltransferase/cysteine synthase family protein [Mobiluncus mulieris]|uniref:O-acetylhomoserine aminocarboxypropyltransferase/cysteine synthase family protein n=1 Tax=Mobiluncus mulieris TaxID=2052 RepID=UPI000CA84F2D|nr:PLP-dependent transferase [Mobiluncus mulieris]PNL43010.1 O-acetylhomoserine aminocarboxypropyltransferase [Mobiluncus mulieris]